jgi:hypothetical protein
MGEEGEPVDVFRAGRQYERFLMKFARRQTPYDRSGDKVVARIVHDHEKGTSTVVYVDSPDQ